MKHAFLLTSAALACALSIPAQAADTLAKVAADNKITFAYRDSSVPFSYLAGADKPVGFGVEISNAVLAAVQKALGKNDIQVGWQSVTSANRIPLLVNGTIDLECGSTTNNSARGKEVSFATNYFYTGTRLMVKKSSGIQNWAELKGKKVAITTGTTNMQVVRRYNDEKSLNLDIIGTKDHADAAMLVETGRADAFAMDDILLFGLKANAKDPAALDVVGQSLQVKPYACMVRKDDPKFKALVDVVTTNWTVFDTLQLNLSRAGIIDLPQENDRTWAFRLGGEYAVSPSTTLRAGYINHGAAAPDQNVVPNLPEGPRAEFTGGFGTNLGQKLQVNVAYQYIKQQERRGRIVSDPSVTNGLFTFNAHLFGATFTYTF